MVFLFGPCFSTSPTSCLIPSCCPKKIIK
jgi:hypothetical protein